MFNKFPVYKSLLPLFLFTAIFFSFSKKSNHVNQNNFDPHAGVVPSLLKGAKIQTSSNQKEAYKIIDENRESAWQSDAPLPEGFIKNGNQNILLNKKPVSAESAFINQSNHFTDGDLNNIGEIKSNNGKATIAYLLKNKSFFSISLKCQIKSAVHFFIEKNNKEKIKIGTYLLKDNFQLKRIEKEYKNVNKLILESEADFNLFEIAALAEAPKEHVIFQFNKPQKIGVLKAKYWAGHGTATKTKLYSSRDGKTWNPILEFDPNAVNEALLNFPEHVASYVKLEHTLVPKDWNKVFFWEIKMYDKNGPYGKKPIANQGAVSIGEILGVNGYWSWGTDQYSFLLGEKEGPRRYKDLISHTRNYHDMTWDITDPDNVIDFSKMKGEGTPAKEWVNWDLEYADWKKTEMDIQASFQFYRFKPEQWNSPEQSAYNYAHAFVKHFGIEKGNGLVCSIEAGNEPWKYPSDIYKKILKGILEGAKAADPKVEVFPCALQAADPEMENTDVFKNYIGARVTPEIAQQLDGLNTHVYSYVNEKNGKRKAVHPEHPLSSFWELNNMVQWRNHNMPGKKIYLSEWGWDCDGGGEHCTHQECVSEQAAAAYAVRGLMIAARMGIERATWYFYANEKMPSSLYTRSGLMSSVNAGFVKKKPFNSLQSLITITGNAYFNKVVREDESAWLYQLSDWKGKPTHLIGWLPIDGDSPQTETIKWTSEKEITASWVLDGVKEEARPIQNPVKTRNGYELKLSAIPKVFVLD